MTFGHRALSMLLLAGMVLASHPARAQAPTSDDLIKEGVEHRRQGDDAAALASFERAYALTPTAHALAQEALAEQALGRWVEADEHLRRALADTAAPWVAKNRAELEDSLATIDKHLGRLEVLGGLAGAEVRVNGRLAGTLPLAAPIAVEAGTATLDVHFPGYLPIARTVAIAPEQLTRETIALVAEVTGPPPAPVLSLSSEPVAARPSWMRSRAAVAFGVGTLGLVTGVIAEIIRAKDFSDFQDRTDCGTSLVNYGGSGCQSLHDSAVLAQDFVVVGLAVAVVGAGLGAYWTATSGKGNEHAGLALSPSRLSCAAAPARGGSGGQVGCAFHF